MPKPIQEPTIAELRDVVYAAKLAANGLKTFPVGAHAKTVDKMSAWLDDLEALALTPLVRSKLAMDVAMEAAPIEGMLAVSTAHITQETAKALANGELALTAYDHGGNGWCIHVHNDNSWVEDGIPVELTLLMLHALQCGCCWLLLDGDATILEDAPTFTWNQ